MGWVTGVQLNPPGQGVVIANKNSTMECLQLNQPGQTNARRFTAVLVTGEMRSGTTLVANLLNPQHGCLVDADPLRSLFLEAEGLGVKNRSLPLSERGRTGRPSDRAFPGKR